MAHTRAADAVGRQAQGRKRSLDGGDTWRGAGGQCPYPWEQHCWSLCCVRCVFERCQLVIVGSTFDFLGPAPVFSALLPACVMKHSRWSGFRAVFLESVFFTMIFSFKLKIYTAWLFRSIACKHNQQLCRLLRTLICAMPSHDLSGGDIRHQGRHSKKLNIKIQKVYRFSISTTPGDHFSYPLPGLDPSSNPTPPSAHESHPLLRPHAQSSDSKPLVPV